MRILILGSGGRECTFAWKLSAELGKDNVFIAPGNAGTADFGENVSLKVTDFEGIATFCLSHGIDTLLPGSEDPLVAGIRNYFESRPDLGHIFVFGPDKQGALMEGSKEFAKEFMMRHGIPTAAYRSFHSGEAAGAKAFLRSLNPPYVIKADGLAAGKGVVIPETLEEADHWVEEMLEGHKFGAAGDTIVIEEFLKGIEVSCFVITDGQHYLLLPEAKDYKRIGEGDQGLNTGGMGAVSPVPFAGQEFMEKVITRIIEPTVKGLHSEDIHYRGFIFFGLIMVNGDPYVIEYNCRMGDPETEVVIPRLENSLSAIIQAVRSGQLKQVKPQIREQFCTTVMAVSEGYPGDYPKGREITVGNPGECLVFHAGTERRSGSLVTSGGRVMAVSAFGHSLQDALNLSYRGILQICFDGMYYRRDIGQDLLKQQSS